MTFSGNRGRRRVVGGSGGRSGGRSGGGGGGGRGGRRGEPTRRQAPEDGRTDGRDNFTSPKQRPFRRNERSKRDRPSSSYSSTTRNRMPVDPNVVRPLDHVVTVSRQSIHNAWKQELGGLIRWYMNLPEHRSQPNQALEAIERIYRTNRCDIEATKNGLLHSIAAIQGTTDVIENNSWIELRMIVEHPSPPNVSVDKQHSPQHTTIIDNITYETIREGRGVVLKTETRRGEGPAHAGTLWTVVKIPNWAIHRPYYLDVINRSTLDLSCEMSIDGHPAAKNAPIPAQERRTIQPACHRYFETHEWRLAPSKSIPLHQASQLLLSEPPETVLSRVKTEPGLEGPRDIRMEPRRELQRGVRYNEKRPDYHGARVSPQDFPDPSTFGWTFTGSREPSRVEFFEKRLNDGSVCKMDFFYTTASIKTTPYHPVQQRRTQLFRRCLGAEPDIFLRILNNPRYHSNLGYSTRNNLPSAVGPTQAAFETGDETMKDDPDFEDDPITTGSTYYAKNEHYAFDIAGHENRQAAMAVLQPSREFQAWEKATKQDWACIHARLFVSMRRYMRPDIAQRTTRTTEERIHLPDMTPVVQVQAAQNAVVSTRFHSKGISPDIARKSRVRMERVKGLNDNLEWGTGPLFDMKLYYRAETVLEQGSDLSMDEDYEDIADSDDELRGPETAEIPLADHLRDSMPLEEYKTEKIDQLHRWFQSCKARDRNEGNARVTQTQASIRDATSTEAVDDYLKTYWDWHMLQELS